MIKIAVGGAHGRMGNLIIKAVQDDDDTELAARVLRRTSDGHGGLIAINTPVDVYIDFTMPVATLENLMICKERGYRMVIGTTGLTEAQKAEIEKAAKVIPIVLSPNMSIGMNITFKLVELVAGILKDRADVAILDIHHKHKKDAPSGTALKMRSKIAKGKGVPVSEADIDIASLRIGEVSGEHTAFFALEGEEIEITHKTFSRMLFARGAIYAAKWIMDKNPGLYDMQDVLGLTT